MSYSLVVQLKIKCLLKEPTHDDIIEANSPAVFRRILGGPGT